MAKKIQQLFIFFLLLLEIGFASAQLFRTSIEILRRAETSRPRVSLVLLIAILDLVNFVMEFFEVEKYGEIRTTSDSEETSAGERVVKSIKALLTITYYGSAPIALLIIAAYTDRKYWLLTKIPEWMHYCWMPLVLVSAGVPVLFQFFSIENFEMIANVVGKLGLIVLPNLSFSLLFACIHVQNATPSKKQNTVTNACNCT